MLQHTAHVLQIGAALPAEGVKQEVHQVAGTHSGALPDEIAAQQLLGGIVCPNQIGGAVIADKILLTRQVKVHAALLIHGRRAESGVVIPINEQDCRNGLGTQTLQLRQQDILSSAARAR